MKTKIWNPILNVYSEYEVIDGAYYDNGERVLRIETAWEKRNKVIYSLYIYR